MIDKERLTKEFVEGLRRLEPPRRQWVLTGWKDGKQYTFYSDNGSFRIKTEGKTSDGRS